MAEPSTALVVLFYILHILGLLGLLGVLLSITRARSTSKHPALLNLCATWSFSSIIYTLLLYAGEPYRQQPTYGLCLAQASMVNGAFPMTSVASVILVVHIWHGLISTKRWTLAGYESRTIKKARLVLALIAPYVTFLAFTIASVIDAHANPERINSRDAFFYCKFKNSNIFAHAVPIFVIIAMICILSHEAFICLKMYKDPYIKAVMDHTEFLLFLLRLAGFTTYAIIAIITACLFLSDSRNSAPYILQALLPIAVLIFLGTQKEVLKLWHGQFVIFKDKFEDIITSKPVRPQLIKTPSFLQSLEYPFTKKRTAVNGDDATFQSRTLESTVPRGLAPPTRPKRPDRTGLSGTESTFGNNLPLTIMPRKKYADKRAHEKRKTPSGPRDPYRLQAPVSILGKPKELFEGSVHFEQNTIKERVKSYDLGMPDEKERSGIRERADAIAGKPAAEPVKPMGSSCEISNISVYGEERDQSAIIETQRTTIWRLLDENRQIKRSVNHMSKQAEKMNSGEKNLLRLHATMKREIDDLKGQVSRLKAEKLSSGGTIQELLTAIATLQGRLTEREGDRRVLSNEINSLSEALQFTVGNELKWKEKYEELKREFNQANWSATNLAKERDVLLDIWATLDSPIDWEIRKGSKNSSRHLQDAFPELARKMRQRASTPALRFQKRSETPAPPLPATGKPMASAVPLPCPTPMQAVARPSAAFGAQAARNADTPGKKRETGLTISMLDQLRWRSLERSESGASTDISEQRQSQVERQELTGSALVNELVVELHEGIPTNEFSHMQFGSRSGQLSIPNSISSSMLDSDEFM